MKPLYRKFYFVLGFTFLFISAEIFLALAASNFDLANLRSQNAIFTKAYDIIQVQNAWEKIQSSNPQISNIKIGIIDVDGVDINHPEFKGELINGSLVGSVDFGNTPSSARIDEGGHGTAVSGIIGANNISFFKTLTADSPQMSGIVSGVSPQLKYSLEVRKIPSFALFFDQLRAIFQSKLSGADVINMSIGEVKHSALTKEQQDSGFIEGQANALEFFRDTQIFKLMFKSAPETLFIVSAGNEAVDSSNATPANLGSELSNVVTAGATNLDDQRAKFNSFQESNFGGGITLSAPGKQVYAPKPGNQYDPNFSGTSASAPMVTGVAGLIKAIKPGLSPAEIKDILVKNADPIQTDKPIGGRLNALKAVCDPRVLNCAPTPPPTAPAAWPMLQKDAQHTGLADVAGPPFATSTAVNVKWQKPLGLLTGFPILIDRGKIYVGAGLNLLAFDAVSGNQIWQTNIPAGATNGAVGPDGTIYVCGLNSNLQSVLTAVDANSHQIKWQFNVGFFRPCNSPVVDKNGIIYTSVPPAFNTQLAAAVAVNPDGTQKWRYEEGNIATTPPALSNDESQVYVVFFNRLLAFSSATGQIVWTQNLPVAAGFPNLPVVDKDERILILNPSDFSGAITAFSKSGTVLWQKSSNAFFISLYPNGKITAVSLSDLSLLNSSDGTVVANSKVSLPANSIPLGIIPPAVDANGLVYIPLRLSDTSAGLAVLDANGLRWTFSTPATGFTATGGSALLDNRLYFSVQGILFSFGQ